MDYLKLLKDLKKEFLKKGKEKYENMSFIFRLVFTLFFIPFRIGFFFARGIYWLTWFFFKALSVPVDYLQSWFKKEKENASNAAQVVLYLSAHYFGLYFLCILLPVVWPYARILHHDSRCSKVAARHQ